MGNKLTRRKFIENTAMTGIGLSLMTRHSFPALMQVSRKLEFVEPKREFSKLQEVPFQFIKIDDPFWNERIQKVQSKTIPDLLAIAQEDGLLDNFLVVSGKKKGKYKHIQGRDAVLYKILEAGSYSLVWRKDPELEKKLDELILIIAETQQKDGYLNTQFQLPFGNPVSPERETPWVKRYGYGPEQKWKATVAEWPKGMGQFYCAGHLFEAAAAHFRATGKRSFLNVAIRMADCMDREIDRKNFNFADHPEVEIGLVRLYEVTGEKKYLELADFIAHNSHFQRPVDIGDGENLKPIAQQKNAFGHCVRTMYLYSGFTDLVSYNGNQQDNTGLMNLWNSIAGRKMYLTGGIGNGTEYEQHGHDYDLPNFNAYSECCASIGMIEWNHRLNILTGDAKYADLVEIEVYNSALSGLSMDGTKYFYRNVLAASKNNDQWSQERWRYLFCCPSNLPRFIAGLNRWIFAKDDDAIYANLFVGNTARIPWKNDVLVITEKTNYPWEGEVSFTLESGVPQQFTFAIRIPGWTRDIPIPGGLYEFVNNESAKVKVSINDQPLEFFNIEKGYLRLNRKWKSGDRIDLHFDMPVRKLVAVPEVKENTGYLAIMRGPVIYCLEGIDNSCNIYNISSSDNEHFTPVHHDGLLPGTYALKGTGKFKGTSEIPICLIPYFLWDNRGKSDMTVWIPNKWTKEIEERQIRNSEGNGKKGNTDG